ncbi:hypothetical protein ACFFRR_000963 [Megaselia abdita]
MSEESNERLLERQIGGSNPCQRKRIHANSNDFNDTIWLDAIEKVNECSRNIGESINVCDNEEASPVNIYKDPCSKKSSKSIYVDCYSRPFQDCVEEPKAICNKCSQSKIKRPSEYKKLKDVCNAIEDLYGIAPEHRSQHQCPSCASSKQSNSEVCNPFEKKNTKLKKDNCQGHMSIHGLVNESKNSFDKNNPENCEDTNSNVCKPNPCKWVPIKDDDCGLVEDLDLETFDDSCTSRLVQKESSCSFDDISDIAKQIECICASMGCNQYSSKKNLSNNDTLQIRDSYKCCKQNWNEKNFEVHNEQKEQCLKPISKEIPCSKKEQLPYSCKLCTNPNPKETDPCVLKEMAKKENTELMNCEKKDSCLDLCIEPSYTKLQDCPSASKTKSCQDIKSPVASDVLCTLNRICDILVKYEKKLKTNTSIKKSDRSVEIKKNNFCKSNEDANLSRSSICYSYPSGLESEGFTTPKARISVSILEETEEVINENQSCGNPAENICITDTGHTTERTTSFHSKDCLNTDCEDYKQTPKSNPETNGDHSNSCLQNCCFPFIPIFPMPLCCDAFKCWPITCCPNKVPNCSVPNCSIGENHKCKHGSNNDVNDNGVKQFVSSLLGDLNDMKKTLNNCMEASVKSELCNSCPQCPSCRPSPSPVCCQGYPVSIHCVRSLGNKSLMVYWIVHDFRDISGYEIRMDGCMKNRYFTSGHDCAVIYGVDLCVPHEIELLAVPELKCPEIQTDEDFSKSLIPISTQSGKRKTHFQTNECVWTPSIYIYDPMKQ